MNPKALSRYQLLDRLRPVLGHLLAALLLAAGVSLPAAAAAPGAVVLQYHHIDTRSPAITSTPPDLFRQHLELIRDGGYQVWPMSRLLAAINGETEFDDNVVVITFDDAYLSIHKQALPMLQAMGWPFTVFVATSYILPDPADDAGAADREPQFLSWQQLREMQQAGATIANHTHTHPHLLRRLPNESKRQHLARVQDEISTAQSLLERHLGVTDKLFAYPYGEYDKDIARLVRKMGYMAFGQQSGAVGADSDKSTLPRFPLSGPYANLDSMRTKLATWPMPITTEFQEPVLAADDDARPGLTLTFTRQDLRFDNLVCYGPHGPTELKSLGQGRYLARSTEPVPVGRSRYNCTMPVADSTRFYWFSQMWIRPRPDGSWYPEP